MTGYFVYRTMIEMITRILYVHMYEADEIRSRDPILAKVQSFSKVVCDGLNKLDWPRWHALRS